MAVGFEWQTGWKVYKNATAPAHGQEKYFPKNTVLTTGIGWKAVTDGADIEFVTDPIPLNLQSETLAGLDGESSLIATMRSITLFAQDLSAHQAKAAITRTDAPRLLANFPATFVIVPYPANEDMKAFAQVSGGVRLSNLRKFFDAIGTAGSQGAQDFLGTYHAAYSATLRKVHLSKAQYVDTQWATHQPSKQMRSLAELISLCMNQFRAKNATSYAKVVKYMTFIMSRTDFARLFQELPEAAHYQANPDAWVRYICTDILSQVAGFAPNGADPDGRLIEYEINDMDELPAGKRVTIPVTRKAWLRGMVNGTDLLTAAAHPISRRHYINRSQYMDKFDNHRLRGLGGLGSAMDDIAMTGLQDHGAIFEFRGQQPNIVYTNWKDFSVRVYRFLQTVNFGQQNQ
jgi:hypothetical protein